MTLKDYIANVQEEKDNVNNVIDRTVHMYLTKVKAELDNANIHYTVEDGFGNGKAYRLTVWIKGRMSNFKIELNYPYINFNNNKYHMDERMFNAFLYDLAKRIVL